MDQVVDRLVDRSVADPSSRPIKHESNLGKAIDVAHGDDHNRNGELSWRMSVPYG
jgi:hypothetical protein